MAWQALVTDWLLCAGRSFNIKGEITCVAVWGIRSPSLA
jgi:hypothetical protein